MKIVAVDPFYLRMPVRTAAADGTQDTFLVRVRTDEGFEGWGESDASPLVSMAAYVCPMSHGNIINIRESLLGETLDSPDDVRRLHAKALRQGLDIGQIHHAYSAADIALWDIVGKKRRQPVWRLLGGEKSHAKIPYASILFGDTPDLTGSWAQRLKGRGYRAAKFGWGPMGKGSAEQDRDLVRAARLGLGEEAELMVDAGWAWGRDVATAAERAEGFANCRVTWLEEPLLPDAIREYGELARRSPVPLAAGENAATFRAAEDYVENAGLRFIQIDAGRIGGITVARDVCELAERKGVVYVNHTFKSRLSVAAAIHVFADKEEFRHLEYPAAASPLAEGLVRGALERDDLGRVTATSEPGLGVTVDLDCFRKYLVPVRFDDAGEPLWETPKP